MSTRNPVFFLAPAAKFLSFFSMLPYFDFQNNTLVKEQRYKKKIVVFIVFLIFLYAVQFWQKFRDYGVGDDLKILGVMTEACQYFALLAAIFNSYRQRSIWCKLFRKLSSVDKILSVERSKFEKNVFKHAIRFMVYFAIFIFILIFGNYAFWSRLKKDRSKLIINLTLLPLFAFIVTIYNFWESFIVAGLLSAIKIKYQNVNKLLAGLQSKESRTNFDISDTIRKVDLMFFYLHNIITYFNKLFDIQILMMVINAFLNFLFVGRFMRQYGFVLFTVLMLIFYMAPVTICIFLCDLSNKEKTKLKTTCMKVRESFEEKSEHYQEIDGLLFKIGVLKNDFTAARFFTIKRSTLISLLSCTATYFNALGNSSL